MRLFNWGLSGRPQTPSGAYQKNGDDISVQKRTVIGCPLFILDLLFKEFRVITIEINCNCVPICPPSSRNIRSPHFHFDIKINRFFCTVRVFKQYFFYFKRIDSRTVSDRSVFALVSYILSCGYRTYSFCYKTRFVVNRIISRIANSIIHFICNCIVVYSLCSCILGCK